MLFHIFIYVLCVASHHLHISDPIININSS